MIRRLGLVILRAVSVPPIVFLGFVVGLFRPRRLVSTAADRMRAEFDAIELLVSLFGGRAPTRKAFDDAHAQLIDALATTFRYIDLLDAANANDAGSAVVIEESRTYRAAIQSSLETIRFLRAPETKSAIKVALTDLQHATGRYMARAQRATDDIN